MRMRANIESKGPAARRVLAWLSELIDHRNIAPAGQPNPGDGAP